MHLNYMSFSNHAFPVCLGQDIGTLSSVEGLQNANYVQPVDSPENINGKEHHGMKQVSSHIPALITNGHLMHEQQLIHLACI